MADVCSLGPGVRLLTVVCSSRPTPRPSAHGSCHHLPRYSPRPSSSDETLGTADCRVKAFSCEREVDRCSPLCPQRSPVTMDVTSVLY